MAASAAQKVVDSIAVIFVESTFAQMDGVLKIGSGDAAVVIRPSALTDQPVAASACASTRCSGRSSREVLNMHARRWVQMATQLECAQTLKAEQNPSDRKAANVARAGVLAPALVGVLVRGACEPLRELAAASKNSPVLVSDIIGCFRWTVPPMYGARSSILRPSE
jgi:hypothetical protein